MRNLYLGWSTNLLQNFGPCPIAQSVAYRTWKQGLQVRSPARPIPYSFSRIDDSHWDRTHSSLTAVHCFDNGYVGKQPLGWKEYCVEYWLKELQESMDRCTARRDITEILLITALNTMQSIKLWNPEKSIKNEKFQFMSACADCAGWHWSILFAKAFRLVDCVWRRFQQYLRVIAAAIAPIHAFLEIF